MLAELDLIASERFFVARRRTGMKQQEFAEQVGMDFKRYRELETDSLPRRVRRQVCDSVDVPEIDDLQDDEIIAILRRRLMWGIAEAAEHFNVSKSTWVLIESGGRATAKWAQTIIPEMLELVDGAAN